MFSLVTFMYQRPSGQIIILGPKGQRSRQPLLATRIFPFRLSSLQAFLSSSTTSSEPLKPQEGLTPCRLLMQMKICLLYGCDRLIMSPLDPIEIYIRKYFDLHVESGVSM